MNKKYSIDMTSGSVPKLLIRFVIPLLVTNMFQQLYTAADSAVIGQFAGNRHWQLLEQRDMQRI